ncbi:MAG: hypothetical protein ACLPKB_03510 [Xanthobacteraceae bacterium]
MRPIALAAKTTALGAFYVALFVAGIVLLVAASILQELFGLVFPYVVIPMLLFVVVIACTLLPDRAV